MTFKPGDSIKSGNEILNAFESGDVYLRIAPAPATVNPATPDAYEIVIDIGHQEFARLGVWKDGTGGTVGDGAPHTSFDGTTVHVAAGDGMNGSFDIECEFEGEAEEVAKELGEQLTSEYDAIEVEIDSY